MNHKLSPFLIPGPVAAADELCIVHLKRDHQIPVILREHDEDDEGYAEGKVLNTRFGNFPHRTLIGLPWGSQVRASKVDTGSRGRRKKVDNLKRKNEDIDAINCNDENIKVENSQEGNQDMCMSPSLVKEVKKVEAAPSGFIHILPPTPENWTSSLPHRTQVVYTPDYSYILHRLRVRPGSCLIEAGAGSGSFTHASARAVFNGYPRKSPNESDSSSSEDGKFGKVWSFEFHEQRYEKLQKEVRDHGLEGIVEVVHRDVCTDGFVIDQQSAPSRDEIDSQVELVSGVTEATLTDNKILLQRRKSPMASAVFLDLPAPWLVLPHLTRSPVTLPHFEYLPRVTSSQNPDTIPFVSALDSSVPIHICTFSPCIEQVQRTVSAMRRFGWVDIETVELSHKRYEIRRERIGLSSTDARRGLHMTPANVAEAVERLIKVEGTIKAYHEKSACSIPSDKFLITEESTTDLLADKKQSKENPSRRENIIKNLVENKSYKQGRLVHRTENELKTHTSYLVFAVLPQEWSEKDELLAREKWPLPSDGGDYEVLDVPKPVSQDMAK